MKRFAVVVLFALLLAASSLPAQQKPEGPFVRLSEAEEALGKGKKEDAAAMLRSAAREVPGLPSEALRQSLERTIADLLKRADPLDAVRRKAEADAARALVGVADGYLKAGWPRTAHAMLEQAARYDVAVAREAVEQRREQLAPVLTKLLGLPAEPQAPAQNQQLVEWFTNGKLLWGAAAWKLSADGIDSPQGLQQPTMFVTGRKTGAKAKVSIQVRTGDRPSQVGLVLAGRGPTAFCLVSLHHEERHSMLQVLRWSGQDFDVIKQQPLLFSPAARDGWMTLAAEFGDGNLKVRCGLAEPIVVAAPVVEMSGTLGLFVETATPNKDPVRARNLVVEQPNQ